MEENTTIYEKKQVIFSDSLGVCVVAEVTKLSSGKTEPVLYYKLNSLYEKGKTAYVPAVGHKVKLRELITVEEAEKLKEKVTEDTEPMILHEINYVLEKNKK
ncbi:MAG: CarD-like/TRCF domain protein [Lachnospiraceae bacterium]|nr:CarD-like/TRCF domain protein [Lachnospiraceae bacterium]MBQ4069216.1 CarD-like/TRCF domain protein [Lachnospiraceae bacterium]